jgi:hypothetical protein
MTTEDKYRAALVAINLADTVQEAQCIATEALYGDIGGAFTAAQYCEFCDDRPVCKVCGRGK